MKGAEALELACSAIQLHAFEDFAAVVLDGLLAIMVSFDSVDASAVFEDRCSSSG